MFTFQCYCIILQILNLYNYGNYGNFMNLYIAIIQHDTVYFLLPMTSLKRYIQSLLEGFCFAAEGLW